MTTVSPRPRVSRRVRTPLIDIDRQILAFLDSWSTAKDAGAARDKARDAIKGWFSKGGDASHEITVNDNGSQLVEFTEVKEIGGRKFLGIENRRTVSSSLDPDLIDEWLEALPKVKREQISKKIIKQVTEYVIDTDALMALNQSGEIDDDTLDTFYRTDEKWSLNVVPA